jgi:hypothetical protein
MQILEKLIETLSKIRDLMLRHDYPGQGTSIDRLIKTAQEDNERLAAGIANGKIYGEAGGLLKRMECPNTDLPGER